MVFLYEEEELSNYLCRLASKVAKDEGTRRHRALVRLYTEEVSPGVVLQTIGAPVMVLENVADAASIFAPVWVLRHLKVVPGDEVKCEQVPLNEENVRRIGSQDSGVPDKIRLVYREHVNYRHWDEYSPLDAGVSIPGEWDSKWPLGLSSDVLSVMTPSLLAGVPLCHGAVVAFDVLQTLVMFEVDIVGVGGPSVVWMIGSEYLRASTADSNHDIHNNDTGTLGIEKKKANRLFLIEVPKKSEDDNEDAGLSKGQGNAGTEATTAGTEAAAAKAHLTPSGQLLLQKLTVLATSALPSVSPDAAAPAKRWSGPRSAVVCGPQGAGKSFLGEVLFSSLCSLPGCTVLRLRARDLLAHLSSSSRPGATDAEIESQTDAEAETGDGEYSLDALLASFTALCGPSLSTTSAAPAPARGIHRPTVVVIDDVHLLQLAPLVASNREDELACRSVYWAELKALNSTGSGVFPVARVAHCLRRLLHVLSLSGRSQCPGATHASRASGEDQENQRPLVVIGLSSLPPHQQPRSHQGCPVFETAFSVPRGDARDRAVILRYALQREQCSVGTDGGEGLEAGGVSRAAGLLSGYSPADIVTVARHAKALALAASTAPTPVPRAGTSAQVLHVPWGVLMQAVSQVTPAALTQGVDGDDNEGASQSQSRSRWDAGNGDALSWDDFAGYQQAKSLVLTRLLRVSEERAPARGSLQAWVQGGVAGKGGSAGAVLHGPSGCGKTHLGRVVCSEARKLGYNHLVSSGTSLLSPYYGGSEERVRNLFVSARAAAPCVLFIDDFEVLAMRRGGATGTDGGGDGSSGGGGGTESDVAGRVLSTFLNELDGVSAGPGTGGELEDEAAGAGAGASRRVVVIVAVPDLSCLDEALIRPGRLHLHILLDYPNLQEAAAVMRARLRGTPLAPGALQEEGGVGAGWIVDVCRHLLECKIGSGSSRWRLATVSDVLQLCDVAVRAAIREQVAAYGEGGDEREGALRQAVLTKEHLLQSHPPLETHERVARDEKESKPFVFVQ